MFLQVHTLTSYHGSLLNRDDAGLAKRIPFGDATRLRVSSQCLKRHWRFALSGTTSLPGGIRSRLFFEREILPRAVADGLEESRARPLLRRLMEKLISGGVEEGDSLAMKQPVLFGKPEADFLVKLVGDWARTEKPEEALDTALKTDKRNFQAMMRQAGNGDPHAGIEGALFGRFVTSDILARSDACVHVAHAFTVHALDTEVDYFTVVDDLNLAEETGAAHAGDMELGAGLYYGYVVVDLPLLVSNLTGCERSAWAKQPSDDARTVLKGLLRAIATVSPGAKLGATAPYAYSDFVLLETGKSQPRSLANAYLQAVTTKGDMLQRAIEALAAHLASIDSMYGKTAETRHVAATRTVPIAIGPLSSLDAAVDRALAAIFGN